MASFALPVIRACRPANGLAPATVQVEPNSIVLFPRIIVRNRLLGQMSRRNLGPGLPGFPLREGPIPGTTMHRIFGALYREEAYLTPAVICRLNILKNGAGRLLPASPAD